IRVDGGVASEAGRRKERACRAVDVGGRFLPALKNELALVIVEPVLGQQRDSFAVRLDLSFREPRHHATPSAGRSTSSARHGGVTCSWKSSAKSRMPIASASSSNRGVKPIWRHRSKAIRLSCAVLVARGILPRKCRRQVAMFTSTI